MCSVEFGRDSEFSFGEFKCLSRKFLELDHKYCYMYINVDVLLLLKVLAVLVLHIFIIKFSIYTLS